MKEITNKSRKNYAQAGLDVYLGVVVIALAAIGLVMIASASMDVAGATLSKPFFYLERHAIYLGISILLGYIMWHIPLKIYLQSAKYILLICLFLLLLVLIPGIGKQLNGSTRWLGFAGITFQPAELAKLGAIIFLAQYMAKYQDKVKNEWGAFFRPIILLGLFAVLLLLEPDFGSTVVILSTALMIMFLGGARIKHFLVLSSGLCGAFLILAISSPYRLKRLTSFLNPWEDQFNTGYQLTQSLIAFGRGELFGLGLGNSVQKLFYLPEAHSDFIFAVIAEELGLIGVITILGLFATLVVRIFMIGMKAQEQANLFGAFLSYGIAVWLGMQVLINIGVTIGLLPTKGLTLPLVSAGGSSILVVSIALSIVFRVNFECNSKWQKQHKVKHFVNW